MNGNNQMKERMHQELLYLPNDREIMEEQERCQELLYDYNQTRPSQKAERTELLTTVLWSRRFMPISEGNLFISGRISMPIII